MFANWVVVSELFLSNLYSVLVLQGITLTLKYLLTERTL